MVQTKQSRQLQEELAQQTQLIAKKDSVISQLLCGLQQLQGEVDKAVATLGGLQNLHPQQLGLTASQLRLAAASVQPLLNSLLYGNEQQQQQGITAVAPWGQLQQYGYAATSAAAAAQAGGASAVVPPAAAVDAGGTHLAALPVDIPDVAKPRGRSAAKRTAATKPKPAANAGAAAKGRRGTKASRAAAATTNVASAEAAPPAAKRARSASTVAATRGGATGRSMLGKRDGNGAAIAAAAAADKAPADDGRVRPQRGAAAAANGQGVLAAAGGAAGAKRKTSADALQKDQLAAAAAAAYVGAEPLAAAAAAAATAAALQQRQHTASAKAAVAPVAVDYVKPAFKAAAAVAAAAQHNAVPAAHAAALEAKHSAVPAAAAAAAAAKPKTVHLRQLKPLAPLFGLSAAAPAAAAAAAAKPDAVPAAAAAAAAKNKGTPTAAIPPPAAAALSLKPHRTAKQVLESFVRSFSSTPLLTWGQVPNDREKSTAAVRELQAWLKECPSVNSFHFCDDPAAVEGVIGLLEGTGCEAQAAAVSVFDLVYSDAGCLFPIRIADEHKLLQNLKPLLNSSNPQLATAAVQLVQKISNKSTKGQQFVAGSEQIIAALSALLLPSMPAAAAAAAPLLEKLCGVEGSSVGKDVCEIVRSTPNAIYRLKSLYVSQRNQQGLGSAAATALAQKGSLQQACSSVAVILRHLGESVPSLVPAASTASCIGCNQQPSQWLW